VKFRLGTIPVRVHAPFFFLALFMVSNQRDPRTIALWVAIVFVSILVHELGHALVGRSFGLTPQIDIHGMGGTTSWTSGPAVGYGRRILISLAGPFAGFLLGLVAILVSRRIGEGGPYADYAFRQLWWVNLQWGVFNLLPLLPLDGGNVMKTTLDALTKGRGEKPARFVSLAFCAAMLALAGWQRLWILGVLAVIFGVSNVRGLRDVDRRRTDGALAEVLERANEEIRREAFDRAVTMLRPALAAPGASDELRSMGVQMLAYALLRELRWGELVVVLEQEHGLFPQEELSRYGRTARELGRTEDAARIDVLAERAGAPLGTFKA